MSKKFVLIGVGYVAPKHMKAIKEVGGDLIACLDPHDSVGILDSYFPDCQYFREFERFDRFCSNERVDFVSICSPNYLHDSHCFFGLRLGASVICEKPLVLNPRNLEQLQLLEDESIGEVWNILQLRLSSLAIKLKTEIVPNMKSDEVSLIYHTPRGDWYDYSWKSNVEKSGGIATNIGIHLFDLLLWLFGEKWSIRYWNCTPRQAVGTFKIGGKIIDVDLSIEKHNIPKRVIVIDGISYDLSSNFGDLHTLSYSKILDGEGFGIKDVFPAINLCAHLRSLK